MRTSIACRKIELTQGLRDYAERKADKLDKFFGDGAEAKFVFSVEKDRQKAELTVFSLNAIYRVETVTEDMYASIDGVVDKLERQIRKYKTKINRKGKVQTINDLPPAQDAAPVAEEEGKIIKTKTFVVKPMDEEEAIMQMELLEHDFFVFLNAETNSINVVYKRKDNQYGLIQPTVD